MSASLAVDPPSAADLERQGDAAFVLSLRARGIFDTDVLRALETVPRGYFAPRRFGDLARADVALPLACGQTMTAPAVVATMLVALDARAGHRVLEVGTGSGYVSALLARIGCEVTSVERDRILAESACSRIAAAGYRDRVQVACGDGLGGGPGDARYDRILLNGVVPQIGPALTSRLAGGGRLVGGIPAEGLPHLVTVVRSPDGQLSQSIGARIRLSPLSSRVWN